MAKKKPNVVMAAAQMWPRIVFDFDGKATVKECLTEPGVYVLFRDDVPYYVGKTDKTLFRRIRAHAIKTRDRYYHFWNYFSRRPRRIPRGGEPMGLMVDTNVGPTPFSPPPCSPAG